MANLISNRVKNVKQKKVGDPCTKFNAIKPITVTFFENYTEMTATKQ